MAAPDLFVQWKGTNACADFLCRCGNSFHFDRDFLYYIQCHACGAVYQVPHTLALVEVTEGWSDPMAAPLTDGLIQVTNPEGEDH